MEKHLIHDSSFQFFILSVIMQIVNQLLLRLVLFEEFIELSRFKNSWRKESNDLVKISQDVVLIYNLSQSKDIRCAIQQSTEA